MTEGQDINLGGVIYMMPPVPLAGLAKLGDKTKLIGTDITEQATEALVDCVYLSLRRNYPEINRDFVESNIDMLNYRHILEAFVSVNGFVKVEKPGEAVAATA